MERTAFDASVAEIDGVIASLQKDRDDLLAENREAIRADKESRDEVAIVERASRVNALSTDITLKAKEREHMLVQAADFGGPHPTLIALDKFCAGGTDALSDTQVQAHLPPDSLKGAKGKGDVFHFDERVLAYPEARAAIRAAAPATGPGNADAGADLTKSVIETGVAPLGFRHISFGQVDAVAQSVIRERGNPFRFPQIDDTGAAKIGESKIPQGTTATGEDVDEFTGVLMNPGDVFSKYAMVQIQAEDDYSGLGAVIGNALVVRVAREMNGKLTNGPGTANQPFGVTQCVGFTVATSGSGAPKAIVEANLLGLLKLDSIQPYLDMSVLNAMGLPVMGNGPTWMMSRSVLVDLVNILGTDSGKFWWADRARGMPTMLYGYPININNDMQKGTAANQNTILLGDFWNYAVVRVGGITVYRDVDSRTRRTMQAQYLAHTRYDGAPVYGLSTTSDTRNNLRTAAWAAVRTAA